MTGFPKFWTKIAKKGALSRDVTPHIFRHSFASVAHDLGYSDLTIGANERLEVIVRFLAVLELYKQGVIDIERMVRALATNPARIFDLENRGTLRSDAYADVTILDPAFEWTFDASRSKSKQAFQSRWRTSPSRR